MDAAAHEIRLTKLAKRAGCAAKQPPGYLLPLLGMLPAVNDPRVLIGSATADDAAVYQLSNDLALVLTTDFFTPVVDRPYDFGAIAAANALSDVYAMGGKPLTALNIVGFPDAALPVEVLAEILRGAADKAKDAGIDIVGGHTIRSDEPIFGLAVVGTVHPKKVLSNAGAKSGDLLVLTKPIGLGIITTAAKNNEDRRGAIGEAINLMTTLNRIAAEVIVEIGVSALTDVTGFGLLGHLRNMTAGSQVTARIWHDRVPVLAAAREYVHAGIAPGGTHANRKFLADWVEFAADLSEPDRLLLCDAQTSGGLLASVAPDRADALCRELLGRGVPAAAIIGRIEDGPSGASSLPILRRRKSSSQLNTFRIGHGTLKRTASTVEALTMTATCPRCSRANPVEAMFCYFDGQALPGRGSRGPLQAGTMPFKVPFVFPNGLSCANFNQFAMGCQKNWEDARGYLREGHWAKFMHAIGRFDLVKTAQQAQAEPDADQGLDLFLAKVPAEVLQAPKLGIEPMQINLGQLRPGTDHAFELTVTNLGMRLLRGSAHVHCDWLTIGDGPGTPEVFFQTPVETHVRVRVIGKYFRAEAKPKIGSVSIETNGGEELVVVRAEAPIVPFPEGVLAGATTPREIALRAKQQPKLAAPLFEKGAVEAWYRNNAWEYPVQGPAGTGLGAIQQFFEALGLAKAPIVTVTPKQLQLAGVAGESVKVEIKVQSSEQRPVFAHAQSNQPWLVANAPVFAGNRVTIPVSIPVIPDSPATTLRTQLTVRANGSQRFVVPVLLDVCSRKTTRVERVDWDSPQPPRVSSVATSTTSKDDGVFGMGRMVYWSGLLGGWSAFAGWLAAESGFGRWIGQTWGAILMIIAVGAAIGGGLSLRSGLVTRQWHNQFGAFGIGLLGGAIAGLIGSVLGNLFYAALGENGGRVVGWTLMGLAIGGWEGIYLRDRIKLRNGLIGGGLGGFLGGLLFNPLNAFLGTAMSSRALGFVVLGLCIGWLIGLVQVLLKDGWLTVIDGFRPGRQLILSQQVTTLGTSEKSNLIFIAYGAKGVEPIHAAIERSPRGAYVVCDRQSRTGTLVNGEPIVGPRGLHDGDIIQLGVNCVRFNERLRTMDSSKE